MQPDFSQPQRQSKIGVLVMFFDTIRHFIRGLWPLLVVWFINRDTLQFLYIISFVSVLFIAVSVAAYLRFVNFTFYLDEKDEEFIINEGVFSKTKTVVGLDKIQQINITQSLLQRIIGVYGLEIDTAGSGKDEGKIKAVSHELALALKARLLQNEKRKDDFPKESAEEITAVTGQKPFMEIGLLTLLKVGITSNYMKSFWLIFVFIVTAYDNIRHFVDYDDIRSEKINSYFGNHLALTSIATVVVFFISVILIVNLVRVIVKYFGYTITRQSGSLLLSFGLINTKSTIIKPEKVQIVSLTQNYFQRKMDILGVKIKQATGGDKMEQGKEQAIEIPGCDAKERDAILKLLYHAVPEKGVMLKPNFRKLVFSIFLIIVLPLSAFYALAYWTEPRFYEFAYVTWVYAILILLVLGFGFRNYRLFIHDRFIIKQSGAWDISNDIVEPEKIQAITTSQLFWHKSADIGYLTLHTAGGDLSFQLGDFTKIKEYVNLWLYGMESSDSNWM
jgi:putative membrane protein